ncbi:MAG: CheR family methyltransferase [Thermodesulfobacteriota bacterium]
MIHAVELQDRDFHRLTDLVYRKCGIHLNDNKRELLRARLGKRLRSRGLRSFNEYYRLLTEEDDGEELTRMLDSISTNLTRFFREEKHFEFLRREVLPAVAGSPRAGERLKLRVWSAGCSSGEEPYSLAMWILETWGRESKPDLRILATDISTKVLAGAVQGVYHQSRVHSVPGDFQRRYFQKGCGNWQGYLRVKADLRRIIEFRRLNLMEPFSFPEPFDFIFCRNVMIYFDRAMQERLINRFHGCLREGGYLFVGHSESLMSLSHPYRYVCPAVYQRAENS